MLTGDTPGDRSSGSPDALATRGPDSRPIWLVAAAGLALVVYFDLGPPLAFNDDWGFAWTTRHLAAGELRVYPGSSAYGLTQAVWAIVVTLDHLDQRLLRLSEIGFILLAIFCIYRLTRLLGVNRFWSSVAACAPLAYPVFTGDAMTYMSDVPYVGLVLAVAYAASLWLIRGSRRAALACIALLGLAAAERQFGALLPLGITGAFLLLPGRRSRPRGDWVLLAAAWAAAAGTVLLPVLLGIAPPTQGNRLWALLGVDPIFRVSAALFLPSMIGLAMVPFLPGALAASRPRPLRDHRGPLIFGLLLWEAGLLWLHGYNVFTGNVFTPVALNLTMGCCGKPHIYADWVFLAIELLAIAAFAVVVIWRYQCWTPRSLGPIGVLLLGLAASQLPALFIVHYIPLDRYYMPIAILVLPVAATTAGQAPARGLVGALTGLLLGGGVVVYAIGAQDYEGWMVARDQAARMAYRLAGSPALVNAGYESNAVYVEVPTYDQRGIMLGGLAVPGAPDWSVDGPRYPGYHIETVGPNDPRPGATYHSLASGRVVVVRGPGGY